MAKIAAKLISENLKYPDGTPVQCVIGCTTIGGGAEAARVAEQFQMENVVATLSVTPCWCYGTETFDMDPNTIKAVWGFNGTERPGAVYLAAVMAAHAQRGLPAFPSMDMMCRMQRIRQFPQMCWRKSYVSPGELWP